MMEVNAVHCLRYSICTQRLARMVSIRLRRGQWSRNGNAVSKVYGREQRRGKVLVGHMRYRWLKPVESFIGKIASRAAARRLAYYPIWPPKSGRNSPAPEGCAAGGHSRAGPPRP